MTHVTLYLTTDQRADTRVWSAVEGWQPFAADRAHGDQLGGHSTVSRRSAEELLADLREQVRTVEAFIERKQAR